MSKSLIYRKFGEPEQVLELTEREKRELQAGELRVRMHYAPVNPSDLIPMTGAYAHRTSLPEIAGYEGVGRIVEVGNGVSSELLGRRILPLQGEGTWQEEVICDLEQAFFVPEGLGDLSASQLYINPLTAYLLCTEVFHLGKGKTLAVNAGGSAIGKLFAQFSKIFDFDYIAICRDKYHDEELLTLGASEVRQNLAGLAVDAAIDCVGGQAGTDLAACVKAGGQFQTLGLLSGEQIDWERVSQLPIEVGIFHLRHWILDGKWQEQLMTIAQLVLEGRLAINRNVEIFSFTEFKSALSSDKKAILYFSEN